MSSPALILVYGTDAHLLKTRRWVLERSGACVWTATDLKGFSEVPATEQIDLIILCHSLSMEECGRGLAVAHMRWPRVQSLILTSGVRGCDGGFQDQVADASLGPVYLLKAVSRLVGPEHFLNFQAT